MRCRSLPRLYATPIAVVRQNPSGALCRASSKSDSVEQCSSDENESPSAWVLARVVTGVSLVVPPPRHPNGSVADAYPRVEPRAQSPERALIGGHGAPSEAEGCSQESGALVEHGLFDDLVRSPQHRLRDRQPESLRGLQIDDQLEFGGLFDRKIGGLGALEDLVDQYRHTAIDVLHLPTPAEQGYRHCGFRRADST